MYDVIVVGARVAGSPTAMLLAQKGLKVLLVDRAHFPSDTLSTHQVQLKGVAALRRWGLLEKVMQTNCPPVGEMAFHIDTFHLHGRYQPLDGLGAILCPRRIGLDKILVEAAVSAGAELRQDFVVEEVVSDAGKVTGMRGHAKTDASGGGSVTENARLVIGADGKHSLVAKAVSAPEYHVLKPHTCAYYVYWEGLSLDCGELYNLPEAVVGVWPTNDGQVIIYTGYPISQFDAIRGDIENHFWQTVQAVPSLAERLRAGRPASRFYGTADLPGFYRRPYGPGWALVGDAGLSLDPITGQGIGNAFCDAERLAEAIETGLSGRQPMEKAMRIYEKKRNAETLRMYEFTRQIAAFTPATIQQDVLFASLEKKPAETEKFFGMLTGSVPVKDFFSPGSLFRMIGMGGMARLAFGKRKPAAAGAPTDVELEAN
jgi:flavin-dependent dehydrogenase